MRSCVVKFSPRSATNRCAAASSASVLAGPRVPLRRASLFVGRLAGRLAGALAFDFALAGDGGISPIYRSAGWGQDDHRDHALGPRLVHVVVRPDLVHDLPEAGLLVQRRRAGGYGNDLGTDLDLR